MVGVRLTELAMCQSGKTADQSATRATMHKKNAVRANRRYAPVAKCYPIFTRIRRGKKKWQNNHYGCEKQLNPLMCAKALFKDTDCICLPVHRPALARAPIAIEIAL